MLPASVMILKQALLCLYALLLYADPLLGH
jgi:hypothetical protein